MLGSTASDGASGTIQGIVEGVLIYGEAWEYGIPQGEGGGSTGVVDSSGLFRAA